MDMYDRHCENHFSPQIDLYEHENMKYKLEQLILISITWTYRVAFI